LNQWHIGYIHVFQISCHWGKNKKKAFQQIYRAYPSTCWTAYINVWKTYYTKLHVQMVFLMMNTWCSKHVEDKMNWIKTLIWKVCICWFMLYNRF
jgi:hypothetical protein